MYYRGHRRTNSNTSNISSISRVSYSSDHWLGMDRSTTPTNFLPSLPVSAASQRSIAGSPAVSHEEDLREIIVLAENSKNDTLTCPLCHGVFRDPYIAACGVCFCNYRGRQGPLLFLMITSGECGTMLRETFWQQAIVFVLRT